MGTARCEGRPFSFTSIRTAGVIAGLALLPSCMGNSRPQSSGSIVPATPDHVIQSEHAAPYCQGTNGVTARPCPIWISGPYLVKVFVKGSGVVSLGPPSGCYSYCAVREIYRNKFKIGPGIQCGQAGIEVAAFNSSNQLVGYGRTYVYNGWCR